MFFAHRKSDGQSVSAHLESRLNGPFSCVDCANEVILRKGPFVTAHFAHASSSSCRLNTGETELHRRCKLQIFKHLSRQKNVSDVRMELPLGSNRPDVSARINGVQVAIEVQISCLSMDTIIHRTSEYAKKGIYVLWLLPWTHDLDSGKYIPRVWERWIHAACFGHVYYWVKRLKIVPYRFEPHITLSPANGWRKGRLTSIDARAATRTSRRFRAPVRGKELNLATDFQPRNRTAWSGGKFFVPEAKLFLHVH